MHRLIAALTAVAILLPAASGWSQQAPPPADDGYGRQILLGDAAGLGAGLLSLGLDDADRDMLGNLALVSSTMYGAGALSGPSIHWAHGRTSAGFSSLFWRLAAPPLASVVGLSANCLGSAFANDEFADGCARDGAIGGFFVAQLGVVAVDALVIAQPDSAERHQRGGWYGWQSLAVDAVGLGMGLYFAANLNPPDDIGRPLAMAIGPLATGAWISPIVHAFHGEWLMALADIGIRWVGVPVAGLAGSLGYCAATGAEADCIPNSIGWSILGGTLLAASIDAFVLSHESYEAADGATADALPLTPSLTITGESLSLSLSAAF